MPAPAFGQAVSDRVLSDVKVDQVGDCSTLTVNFNVRVQMLSHFPQTGGRELHIRIKSLDAVNMPALRESLRTPQSVPGLRSIEYEGDNPSGPVLTLFFTKAMRFELEPGEQPNALVIRLAQPGEGPICAGPAEVRPDPGVAPIASSSDQPPVAAAPDQAAPVGLFVVNIVSRPQTPGELTPEQQQAVADRLVYATSVERESQRWHRLRMGFFETREAAEAAKAQLKQQFPDAWVIKVSEQERKQAIGSRLATTSSVPGTFTRGFTGTEADAADTLRLTGEAETAIKASEHDRAIQLLTNALTRPNNVNSPRALELLGLTRERKGQNVHARAEYQEYLRRYPSGEAADRVRQRIAALEPAGATPQATRGLREASGRGSNGRAWTWGARGSFSQFYYRDQTDRTFVDASRPDLTTEQNNLVNLNQLLTSADLTVTGGDDRRQIQIRAAGSYSASFRKPTGKDITTLSALYFDYSNADANVAMRLGRQTRNSAGVLGRFDGMLYGWQVKPDLRVNAVAGYPVLSSRQTHVLRDRFFYGASVDIGAKRSRLQTTLYMFDQRAAGGFVDRRSVGMEARFLNPKFNGFAIIDYDVHYKKLNLGLLTLNYNFPDSSNLSVTADYRRSPLLTTSNALIGQINPTTLQPISKVRGLRPFFTDPEIYQLALDRTLVAKSVTASYSRPITKKLQTSVDFTMTNMGGTPASGGIPALPGTGREYYYGAQLVGTGLLWENDLYIASGRYSDTQNARTVTADFTARVPIVSNFRLSPRVRYGVRHDKVGDGSFKQLQPTMRLNVYPTRNSEIEVELGANFSKQRQTELGVLRTTKETGFVVSAGYRVDF
jgi:hypothetical protein